MVEANITLAGALIKYRGHHGIHDKGVGQGEACGSVYGLSVGNPWLCTDATTGEGGLIEAERRGGVDRTRTIVGVNGRLGSCEEWANLLGSERNLSVPPWVKLLSPSDRHYVRWG